jgi:hypothetical protein
MLTDSANGRWLPGIEDYFYGRLDQSENEFDCWRSYLALIRASQSNAVFEHSD